jgi:uncharacterized protein YwgA
MLVFYLLADNLLIILEFSKYIDGLLSNRGGKKKKLFKLKLFKSKFFLLNFVEYKPDFLGYYSENNKISNNLMVI